MDETTVKFSDIKTMALSSFAGLEKKKYVISWIDDEHDYVVMDSEEDLRSALAKTKGHMLKIEGKIKQNLKNAGRKGHSRKMISLPHQYFANLFAVNQKISGSGSIVLHNQNLEGIRKVIKKHPGVIFIGGECKKEIGEMEEKRKQRLKTKNKGPRKSMKKKGVKNFGKVVVNKNCQNLKVNRIIPGRKAISLLQDLNNETIDDDGKTLSVTFVPICAGRKQQHCHVFGSLEDSSNISVAFKRGGVRREEKGSTSGDLRKMNRQMPGTEGYRSLKHEQKNQNSPSTHLCFIARKRMRMIASRIFHKIDPRAPFFSVRLHC